MSMQDDARNYIDLPKSMQDDDALRFARAVISLYDILDRRKAETDRADRHARCTSVHLEGLTPLTAAFDPALCERLIREARGLATLTTDLLSNHLRAIADQLKAAGSEAEHWKAVALKLDDEKHRAQDEVTRCSTIALDNARDRDRAAAERDALRAEFRRIESELALRDAEVERLTAASQLSRSGAAEAVRAHDQLANDNAQLRTEVEKMRPGVEAAERWYDDGPICAGIKPAVDAYRTSKDRTP